MSGRRIGQVGESLVEVVAMAPIVLLCGLLGLQALAAGAVHVYADNAAHAAALASELGNDPEPAARAALPGWAKGRVKVKIRGQRATVELKPRAIVPQLSKLLVTRAVAAFVPSDGLPK
jgi:hypothetical protein